MNVNEKGTKGLIKVIDDLTDRGLHVFTPFDDHCPIDLIVADKLGKTLRLQIKYKNPIKNKTLERYELTTRSIVNGTPIQIDRTLIDYWAVYLTKRNKVIYIPVGYMEERKALYIDPDVNYGELSFL